MAEKEPILINVGTTRTVGICTKSKKDKIEFLLKIPICADKDERVVLSKRIGDSWRLIGYGIIQ